MYKFYFVDGSQDDYYDPHVVENGLWVQAFHAATHQYTYIPTARIHKFINLEAAFKLDKLKVK